MDSITSLKTYNDLVNQSNDTFIIKLYAPWCSRCHKLESALLEQPPNCSMYKINIDSEPFMDEAEFEEITSLPCVWIFKQGKKIELNNANADKVRETLRK